MNFINSLFGKQPTFQEQMRANKRQLTRAQRDIDRERVKMQNAEKKLLAEIKKSAKQGQMDSAKILAKDLVRTRANISKFYKMSATLKAVELRLQACQSTQMMNGIMAGVSKAMVDINKQFNLPEMQKTMQEFATQNEVMDMKEEMMGDAIDTVMDSGAEEADSEQILSQVLDEIGINVGDSLREAPTRAPVGAVSSTTVQPAAARQPVAAAEFDDSDLVARLAKLKG
eukprot:gnl/Hemi2/3896_TR1367_c2_g1_i1.p1 gnl/Hemi2/3896_TR1367_c2_g1~~gnl/Hemi2/3896_TR1367_c2_g1_i1.p1  ORF type:complete len:228 (-),score=103.36 gnl/Hemi2/3896_TR1367_c2_g1_i1:222-905(-)